MNKLWPVDTSLRIATYSFILMLLSTSSVLASANREALLIGNSAYTVETPLKNPKNDVDDYARALEKNGFRVEIHHNLTRTEMSNVATGFGKKHQGKQGTFLFYYAGHGVSVDGKNFMLPISQANDNPKDYKLFGLDAEEILKRVSGGEQTQAGRANIAILDMCRTQVGRGSAGLAPMSATNGSLIAFSAASGMRAADGDERNSPYAKALIEATQMPNLDIYNYFAHVREKVLLSTHGTQSPEEVNRLTGIAPVFTQVLAPPPITPSSSQSMDNTRAQAPPASQPLIANRYRDNQDGTITDTQTKLQWKRCSEGQSWTDSRCTGKAGKYKWKEARQLTSNFADKTDWRLPTIAEINTLVYCSNGKQRKFKESDYRTIEQEGYFGCGSTTRGDYQSPTIDTQAFPNTPTTRFWSASPSAAYTVFAWLVYFGDGNDYWNYKDGDYSVRLVRGQ